MVDPDGTDTFLAGCGSCWYHGAACEALGYEPYRKANDAKYPSMHAWGSNVVSRLKAWGFNALSGNDFLFHRGLAHAELLTLGEDFVRRGGPENSLTPYEGFPCSAFPNVFNPAFVDWCREVAAKRCAAAKDDASLSGYFLDNELAWWGRDTGAQGKRTGLFDAVDALPPTHSAKRALAAFVGNRQVTDELKGQFLRLVAARYFATTTQAVREADPNHLIYGARFAGFESTDDIVWEEAGKHCDLLAVNVYPHVDYARNMVWSNPFIGGVPVVEFFENAHRRSGRPIVVSEWSFLGLDAKSPSTCGSGQRWPTQKERACAAEFFARVMLSLPCVVGYDWFKHEDAPPLGMTRTCPEDANFGLVDIEDKPYREITDMFTRIHRDFTRLRKEPLPVARAVRRATAAEIGSRFAAFGEDAATGEVRAGRLHFGAFTVNPMIKEVYGTRPDWIDVDEVESREGDVVVFRTTARAGGRRVKTRFTHVAGSPFAGFEILSVENGAEHPVRVESLFFRIAPDDVSGCDVLRDGSAKRPREIVPGLVQRDAWILPGGTFGGFVAVPGEKVTINFARDEELLHPDAEARLVPGVMIAPHDVWVVPERLLVFVTTGEGGAMEWRRRVAFFEAHCGE